MKTLFLKSGLLALAMMFSSVALADDYKIDTKGAHAFVQFKVSHLGYSWIIGRFNKFDGQFSYDENDPTAASIDMTVDVTSVDTNHAERDKHLRSPDFLDTSKYPTASFKSTSLEYLGDGKGKLTGDLTLHGTTNSITLDVMNIGAGDDPWGGYRSGFEGTVTITPADYGMGYNMGPASATVELYIVLEGIRT